MHPLDMNDSLISLGLPLACVFVHRYHLHWLSRVSNIKAAAEEHNLP